MSIRKLPLTLATVAATCIGAATAHAASDRTFVSNIGTNNTQCSVTSPCQTFAQAISVTNSGGEINCLNAGDFGAVTISIPVTIDCEGASNGGITASGSTAIIVNTTGVVDLIGLAINGMNAQGGKGIYVQMGSQVNIRNCKIFGFLANGATGGIAILFEPNASGVSLVVDNVLIANSSDGIIAASVTGGVNMTVRNSNINNTSIAILAELNGGTHSGVTIEQATLSFNHYGVFVSGAGAIAVIGGSTLVNNTVGVATQSGGAAYSFKNNQIGGNGSDGTPLTAYPGGPLN